MITKAKAADATAAGAIYCQRYNRISVAPFTSSSITAVSDNLSSSYDDLAENKAKYQRLSLVGMVQIDSRSPSALI